MFVIVDLEWVTDKDEFYVPTQLAAVRVNENWDSVGQFSSFVRPKNASECVWSHPSYTGGSYEDFKSAKSAYTVLSSFSEWLEDDDILLWWHHESRKAFKKLNSVILSRKTTRKSIILNSFVYTYLKGQVSSTGSPYKIAAARDIPVNAKMQHNSLNDVQVLKRLLKTIALPQRVLLKPEECKKLQLENNLKMPYQYHQETNTIHSKDCELITAQNLVTLGCETFKSAIKHSYNVCKCCKDDYKKALVEHNKIFVEQAGFNYIYSPNSQIYHKTTCRIGIAMKKINGSKKHKTVLKSGRRPCAFCNPTYEEECRILSTKEKLFYLYANKSKGLSEADVKALLRQKTAVEERQSKLANDKLTEEEKTDVYTLTQPGFAFWVGRGYQNFHRHNCQRLKSLSNLQGFSTYSEAVGAGFTPCKQCRPTKKDDVKFSIPITSCVRENEKIEDIVPMCIEAGFSCYKNDKHFYIDTIVGKWKITIDSSPVKLEHINLVKTPYMSDYHIQPRKFLSYADVVEYIKKHDNALIKNSIVISRVSNQ